VSSGVVDVHSHSKTVVQKAPSVLFEGLGAVFGAVAGSAPRTQIRSARQHAKPL
jgi:hypothetical protein